MNYLDPYHTVLSMDAYKFVITSHGIAMIFFFLMPVLLGGFGNFLLPLLVGMSDLALPRLKSMGAWLVPPAAVCFSTSVLLGAGVG